MRTLIDGYNLMYAGGLLGGRFGPEGFRKVRHRFLNDLASTLEPVEAHLTTVVFDANTPAYHIPDSTRHKGISILYAVDVDSADEQIEHMIAHHSSPKTLLVVSSDHRIQKAALRRKAKVISSDAYWTELDARKTRRITQRPAPLELPERPEMSSAGEVAYWMAEFRHVAEAEETREAFARDPIFPSDDEIARIEREVEDEFRGR